MFIVSRYSYNKLKKIFFTQIPAKSFFCISIFNVGGCIASCLTFRLFFKVRPLANWLLIKRKRVFRYFIF